MRRSWVLYVISVIILVLMVANIVLASDTQIIPESAHISMEDVVDAKLSALSIECSAERNELLNEAENLTDTINSEEIVVYDVEDGVSRKQETTDTYVTDFSNMYKVFTLSIEDVVKGYYEVDKQFSDLITDNYLWEAPIRDQNGNVVSSASFRKGVSFEAFEKKSKDMIFENQETKDAVCDFVRSKEGKWYWVRTGNLIPNEEVEFVSDHSALTKYINNLGFPRVEDIKYVSLGIYRTDILYIRAEGKEYGITFTLRPDLAGLENRKLYEIGEIIDILSNMY